MIVKAPIYSISRLRLGTDGKGITSLVAFMGCPLGCRDVARTIGELRSMGFNDIDEFTYITK